DVLVLDTEVEILEGSVLPFDPELVVPDVIVVDPVLVHVEIVPAPGKAVAAREPPDPFDTGVVLCVAVQRVCARRAGAIADLSRLEDQLRRIVVQLVEVVIDLSVDVLCRYRGKRSRERLVDEITVELSLVRQRRRVPARGECHQSYWAVARGLRIGVSGGKR